MASLVGDLPMSMMTATPKASKLAAPDVIRRRVKVPHGVCRLTLDINGTAYNVRPVACDPDAAGKTFRLRKADGTAYHVAKTQHGFTCECPDWVFNREHKDVNGCKHIRSLKACGLL
jgi:hypothetical protein